MCLKKLLCVKTYFLTKIQLLPGLFFSTNNIQCMYALMVNYVKKKKNPAYGRHQLSRPMPIVGSIQI